MDRDNAVPHEGATVDAGIPRAREGTEAMELGPIEECARGLLLRFAEAGCLQTLARPFANGDTVAWLRERFIERRIDLAWVEAIEGSVAALDSIVRDPNRFIRSDETVVPIERARGASTESVKHLARHTRYIARCDDGVVVPSRILNEMKEESLETYENRFVRTLLIRLQKFLERRRQALACDELGWSAEALASSEIGLRGSCWIEGERISYELSVKREETQCRLAKVDCSVRADVDGLTPLQRIIRLQGICAGFLASPLCKALHGCALVRPPITITNVLAKNPCFQVCVGLWSFLDAFEGDGCALTVLDRAGEPSAGGAERLFVAIALAYLASKEEESGVG